MIIEANSDLSEYVERQGDKYVPIAPETGRRINAGYVNNKGSALRAVKQHVASNFATCSSCGRKVSKDEINEIEGYTAKLCGDCVEEYR